MIGDPAASLLGGLLAPARTVRLADGTVGYYSRGQRSVAAPIRAV